MKSVIAVCLLALGLSGCGLFEKPKPEIQIEYRFVVVPVELTERIRLSPPPKPEEYSVLSCDRKEVVLMDLIQERTTELGQANARLTGIRDWSKKQAETFAAPAQ